MAEEKRLIDFEKARKRVMEILAGKVTTQTAVKVSLAMQEATVYAVVLPCEIGREVFYIWSVIDDNGVENFEMSVGKVVSFSIQKDGLWVFSRYEDGLTYWHKVLDDFGRTVYLTRVEAEAALAKMDGGNEDG